MPDHPDEATPGRILVVDDEPHIRRIMTALLRPEGYEVKLARDGTEALRTWRRGSYDLVILDLVMPGANGLEVLSTIRSDPERGATPVIILTAKGQDADRQAAFAAGADDFVTKPFSPKKLVARIHEILGDG